jgi:hypothetical protein
MNLLHNLAKGLYMKCVSDEIRRFQASEKMCDGSAAQPWKMLVLTVLVT